MSVKENIERMRELSRQAELGGGEDRQRRQRESGRMTARERVEFLLDRGSFVELDKFKTHRCDDFGMDERRIPGRRRRHRLRHHRGTPGLRLLAGLHGFRRQPLGRVRREGLQGDGPGDEGRMPGDRTQRFGRRAHPGGRGVAGRLRRHLFAQRDGLGRGAADFRDHGAMRRRRGVLARDDRLHRDGARHLVHVHHRPRRHQGDHARGSLDAGPGRRRHAFDALGRVPPGGG